MKNLNQNNQTFNNFSFGTNLYPVQPSVNIPQNNFGPPQYNIQATSMNNMSFGNTFPVSSSSNNGMSFNAQSKKDPLEDLFG